MESKEQILERYRDDSQFPELSSVVFHKRDCLSAMDQYAEQESISFAEWVAKEGWYFNKIQRWSNRGEKSDNLIEVLSATKSTAELYQLYKKETQQTKTS